jgi:hypothetical protein
MQRSGATARMGEFGNSYGIRKMSSCEFLCEMPAVSSSVRLYIRIFLIMKLSSLLDKILDVH